MVSFDVNPFDMPPGTAWQLLVMIGLGIVVGLIMRPIVDRIDRLEDAEIAAEQMAAWAAWL